MSDEQVVEVVAKSLCKSMTELMNKAEDEDTAMYMEYLFHQLLASGLMKKHGRERYQSYITELLDKETLLVSEKINLQ